MIKHVNILDQLKLKNVTLMSNTKNFLTLHKSHKEFLNTAQK
jgi:glutaredoxin-related protein